MRVLELNQKVCLLRLPTKHFYLKADLDTFSGVRLHHTLPLNEVALHVFVLSDSANRIALPRGRLVNQLKVVKDGPNLVEVLHDALVERQDAELGQNWTCLHLHCQTLDRIYTIDPFHDGIVPQRFLRKVEKIELSQDVLRESCMRLIAKREAGDSARVHSSCCFLYLQGTFASNVPEVVDRHYCQILNL